MQRRALSPAFILELVSAAVSEPPNPALLEAEMTIFGQDFQRKNGRWPSRGEWPPPFEWFLWRIANSDAELEVIAWGEQFFRDHGRYPEFDDVPVRFHRPQRVKRGRPKKELLRWVKARIAWENHFYQTSFQIKREAISLFKELLADTDGKCFGFDSLTVKGSAPSVLAIELVADEFGVSEGYALDRIYPKRRRRKKVHNDH